MSEALAALILRLVLPSSLLGEEALFLFVSLSQSVSLSNCLSILLSFGICTASSSMDFLCGN